MSTPVIRTKPGYKRAWREMEKLMGRPCLSPEDREVCALLMQLTGDYESKTFPRQRSTAVELIEFMLEQNGQPQKVLAPIFGGETHVSEALHGKRAIRLPQAVKLGGCERPRLAYSVATRSSIFWKHSLMPSSIPDFRAPSRSCLLWKSMFIVSVV